MNTETGCVVSVLLNSTFPEKQPDVHGSGNDQNSDVHAAFQESNETNTVTMSMTIHGLFLPGLRSSFMVDFCSGLGIILSCGKEGYYKETHPRPKKGIMVFSNPLVLSLSPRISANGAKSSERSVGLWLRPQTGKKRLLRSRMFSDHPAERSMGRLLAE